MGVVPTVTVKVKETGAELVINKSDFDNELHTRVRVPLTSDAEKTAVEKEDDEEEAPQKTRAELAEMTLGALRALPEYKKLSVVSRSRMRTKDAIINALLSEE